MRAFVLLLISSSAVASPKICDLGDRILVVDAKRTGAITRSDHSSTQPLTGTLTIFTRATKLRVTAPITRSVFSDHCDGRYGSHAGCSERGGDTIHSSLLRDETLALGMSRNYTLTAGSTARSCRAANGDPWERVCATATTLFVVSRGTAGKLALRMFQGTSSEPTLEEAIELKPDGSYVSARAVVSSNGVTLDGKPDACLAVE